MSGVVGDVLWKPGIADLVEGIDQGVLAVRLVSEGGRPKVSQFAGTAFHACLARMSSQCGDRGVAKGQRGQAERTETATESQL